MTWFKDLTPYTYVRYHNRGLGALNVGWLSKGQDFPKEVPPQDFLLRLQYLVENKVVHHFKGQHGCEFCDTTIRDKKLIADRVGNGSIIVIGKDGVHYAAPKLIYHYVKEHHYQPPKEFVDAVMGTMIVHRR